MAQSVASYLASLTAELRRLGAPKDQIKRAEAEFFSYLGDNDPVAVFGPAEQFAGDVVAGRRPLRARYLQDLSMQLSQRGVPGGRIGQILAEVDTHTTDSGQDPQEAFGPPDQYAAQVAAAAGETSRQPETSLTVRLLTSLLGVAGTLLTVEGIVAVLHREAAPLTAGVAAVIAALPVLMTASHALFRPGRSSVRASCLAGLGVLAVTLACEVAVLVSFRQPVLTTLPAWVLIAIGLGCFAGEFALAPPQKYLAGIEPIADPRPGDGARGSSVFDNTDRWEGVSRFTAWGAGGIHLLEITALVIAVLLFR